jgi:hypothetical protein
MKMPSGTLRRSGQYPVPQPCMTVGDLRAVLAGLPDELNVVGTWEGIHVPLQAAAVVNNPHFAGPFLELDVDK